MMNFLRAVWRRRFKRNNRVVLKANACQLGDAEICLCDKSPSKPQQYSPEKGWRLLAHIDYTGTIARIEQTHDIELDEDILERIDFLACLFAGRRINK